MRRLVICLALAIASPVLADSYTWGNSRFNNDFDEEQKPWEEIQSQLPAAPKTENLMAIEVSAASSNRYFIDMASLSVGNDGVVRYTVLIRSTSGAQTVNFEGLRCATSERKIYAFGRADGSWSQNRQARWERFSRSAQDSYHRELFYSYYCPDGAGVQSVERIRHWLRIGGYR